MARQTSFGDMLRHARERKGMDLSTVARKLRIRPDILRAIEESDFARMPPRGYTTNMVGAYARLVGLNPSELTRAYRDESYQFDTGRRPMDRGYGSDRAGGRSVGSGRSSRRGDALLEPAGRSSRTRSSSYGRGGRTHTPQPQYTNLVQGRQAPGITANLGSMLPLVIVGAIIILLLVLVIMLAFGNRGGQVDDTPTIPISGMSNPAGTDASGAPADATATQAPAVEPVAPTSAKFSYTVKEGDEAYIEVYLDGKTEQAQMVTGPKTEEFSITGTMRFVTTSPDYVTATLDGEPVELVDVNQNGIYSYTFNFEEFLSQWRADNGVKAPASDASASGATGSSADSAGASGTSDGSGTTASDGTDSDSATGDGASSGGASGTDDGGGSSDDTSA